MAADSIQDVSIIVSVLSSLQSPVRFSSLSKAHDTLVDALSREQDALSSATSAGTSKTTDLLLARQADYLWALQITCKLLIGILSNEKTASALIANTKESAPPHTETRDHQDSSLIISNGKQKVLQQTIQRCHLLLQVLAKIFRSQGTSEGNTLFPESQQSLLQRVHGDDVIRVAPCLGRPGLYAYKNSRPDDPDSEDDSDDDDDDGGILTFDRAALEQEERDLIQMANTPIPGEGEGGGEVGNSEEKNHSVEDEKGPATKTGEEQDGLQAKLKEEWSKEELEEFQSRQKRQRTD